MNQLDHFAAGALIRARPWDVLGASLAAPMLIWGFLGWFGTVGDSAGGEPGFFAGSGAAGIGLVLAAAAIALNQLLAGRAHDRSSPSVAALLAGAGSIVILGGMIAKPDSVTIQAGSVAGLLTALSQAGVLTMGWLRGSEKSVKATNVRAAQAQQHAADQAAIQLGRAGAYPPYRQPGYPPAGYPPAGYPATGYPSAPAPRYPAAQFPTGQYPYPQAPAGQYPPGGQYPPVGQYPPGTVPAGQYPPVQYPQGPPPGPPSGYGQPGQYPYQQGQNPNGQPRG